MKWKLWRVMTECEARVRPVFAWFDLWVGCFVDRSKPALYVFPLPMIGIRIDWPTADPELYADTLPSGPETIARMIQAGDLDGARAMFREGWPELHGDLMADLARSCACPDCSRETASLCASCVGFGCTAHGSRCGR